MEDFTFVTEKQELQEVTTLLMRSKEIAFDLECENNLHRYGQYLALIQVTDGRHHFIIDPIATGGLGAFQELLESKDHVKIVHDHTFDLRILNAQFSCRVKNVFDTQIAAVFTGKTEVGLAHLLNLYFGVAKETKFQMADWTKRPIKEDMLEYAINDCLYLHKLKQKLIDELKELGRMDWVEVECAAIDEAELFTRTLSFIDLKGAKALGPKERGRLAQIFKVRERLAQKVDRPIHFVINNKRMIELAERPPTLKQWFEMRGVHPIVRRRGKEFYEAIETAKPVPDEPVEKKRYTKEQRQFLQELTNTRNSIAEKLKLPGHLLMNKDQLQQITLTKSLDMLKPWQRAVVSEKVGPLLK
ncbi:HRDC domain-containing protein [Candidatus Woesearchaeota archaeon]|nr:HRDC domain-containing protein [Candidatus Woesearchaeota archaeon]